MLYRISASRLTSIHRHFCQRKRLIRGSFSLVVIVIVVCLLLFVCVSLFFILHVFCYFFALAAKASPKLERPSAASCCRIEQDRAGQGKVGLLRLRQMFVCSLTTEQGAATEQEQQQELWQGQGQGLRIGFFGLRVCARFLCIRFRFLPFWLLIYIYVYCIVYIYIYILFIVCIVYAGYQNTNYAHAGALQRKREGEGEGAGRGRSPWP